MNATEECWRTIGRAGGGGKRGGEWAVGSPLTRSRASMVSLALVCGGGLTACQLLLRHSDVLEQLHPVLHRLVGLGVEQEPPGSGRAG